MLYERRLHQGVSLSVNASVIFLIDWLITKSCLLKVFMVKQCRWFVLIVLIFPITAFIWVLFTCIFYIWLGASFQHISMCVCSGTSTVSPRSPGNGVSQVLRCCKYSCIYQVRMLNIDCLKWAARCCRTELMVIFVFFRLVSQQDTEPYFMVMLSNWDMHIAAWLVIK